MYDVFQLTVKKLKLSLNYTHLNIISANNKQCVSATHYLKHYLVTKVFICLNLKFPFFI